MNKNKEYQNFLSSPVWFKIREETISLRENKCQECGSKDFLEVHHKHYGKKWGQEDIKKDLEVLCRKCHSLKHSRKIPPNSPHKNRVNYYEYINSPQWREKKRQFYTSKLFSKLRRNGGWKCYACLSTAKPLDLHHKTYKRLGNENIAVDLIPLCRECHLLVHKLYKESGNKNLFQKSRLVKRIRKKEKKHNQHKI